jgi:tripartite ATP-independent transporter DctP family solute receptor
MKKKILALSLVTAFILALCGCGSKDDGEIFIMADVQEPGHPTADSCDRFAEIVKEKTDGRVVIEVYHGSTLGAEADQVKQVTVGGIDFARVSTSPLSTYYDDLKAFQALYLFKNTEQMWRVLDGDIGTSMLHSQELTDNGIEGLCWFSGGSRNFYNNKKEIHSPSDLSGLTLRVNTDSMFSFLDACGANGINIAYNDILNSINSGVIDGAENNWPSYISTNHYTAAQYLTVDMHTSIPEMIIASSKAKERMSEEDWQTVQECALEISQYQRKALDDYDAEAIKTAQDSGCTITYLTDDEMSAFSQAAQTVNNEINAKYIDLITVIQNVE